METQPLAQQSLDPISNDCVPYFLGHGDAETPDRQVLLFRERQDVAPVQLPAAGLDRDELGTTT